jgi:exonuclease III
MILISWNCRGLGNPRAVRDLCQMVKEKRPDFLFLMETRSNKQRMEGLRVRLGFEGLFVVNSVGKSGGLALFWKEVELLEIQNYTRRHINAVVKNSERGVIWKLTCMYGHPVWNKRHESWNLLSHLQSYSPQAWMCIGDFNEIVDQTEKCGGVMRRESQMDLFRKVLDECSLSDLGYSGSRFTWSNRQQDGSVIQERLDRGVANSEWCMLHDSWEVEVLAARTSDHNPIMLRTGVQASERCFSAKNFKFEAKWLLDEECSTVIKEAWSKEGEGATNMGNVRQKLNSCQRKLMCWSSRKFGSADKLIKEKTKLLAQLQQNERGDRWEEIKRVQAEIDFILEQEDVKWKQRGKQNWYLNGDRNTPFFHAWASHRRKVNRIEKIRDEEGMVWDKQEEIGMAFARFYQKLFSTGGSTGSDECLAGLRTKVTPEMNANLLKNFTMVEVEMALKQMHPLKSPGPDGFSACFYQSNWATVQMEVCKAVLGFLNHGEFDDELNFTYIALIPKTKKPTAVTEYRPISLCNVMYKLISKVLANRLKKILPEIISPNQSAFIPGRLITDNILVAFEALHTMDRKMKGREGFMALKLDMSKAYDRVEWVFLENVMRKLGFAPRWIQMMMTCVRTVTYAVLIHGKPHGQIKPTRGIRQGDPLSPYLFLLCAEGLSSLLNLAEEENWVTGLPITRGGTRINHLFFAGFSTKCDFRQLMTKVSLMFSNVNPIIKSHKITINYLIHEEKMR